MGSLGVPEMIFIFVLALLLFGPKKLPEVGRTLGKAMSEFRRASSELKATFDREMKTLERETEGIKEAATSFNNETTDYNYNYDYCQCASNCNNYLYWKSLLCNRNCNSYSDWYCRWNLYCSCRRKY